MASSSIKESILKTNIKWLKILVNSILFDTINQKYRL